MYCLKCGKEVRPGSKFCNHCGSALGAAPESKAAPAAPAQTPAKKKGWLLPATLLALILIASAAAGVLLTQEYCYGDMGGSTQYHYDEDGNLAEEVFISRSNETSTTAYRYDRGGNLIETVVDTNYGHSRTEYEYRRA